MSQELQDLMGGCSPKVQSYIRKLRAESKGRRLLAANLSAELAQAKARVDELRVIIATLGGAHEL